MSDPEAPRGRIDAGERSFAASDEIEAGTDLGRYVVRRRIGAGAMGVVYEAWDPELDRRVAIKVLRTAVDPDVRLVARARREAVALARVSHPNVVAAYDARVHEGRIFLAMELVEGETLDVHLRRTRPKWRRIVSLFVAAGRGLAAVHAQGLVHRDFKPSNVLVDAEGRVRVGDFGLARLIGEPVTEPDAERPARALGTSVTHTGAALGTPRYMAPELHRGAAADAASDQFAFCVALWEALHGAHPFAAPDEDPAVAIAKGQLRTPNVRSPRWLVRALKRGLQADPPHRHASMSALVDVLEHTPRRRAIVGAIAGGGALAIAVGTTAYVLAEPRGPICDRAALAWDSTFDDVRREQVRDAFARAGAEPASEAAGRAIEGLDAWGETWSAVRIDACRATHERGEQSAELLDRRMTCLDAQLGVTEGLVLALGEVTQRGVDHAVDAVDGLPDPSTCSRVDLLREHVPIQGEAVAALRRRVDRASAELDLGAASKALEELSAIEDDVRATGDAHLLASTLLSLALAKGRTEDVVGAEALLQEAATAAAASNDRELEARIAVKLLGMAAMSRNLPRLEAQALMARTAVTRAQGPLQLRLELERAYARGLIIQAEWDRGADACTELARVAAEVGVPEHPFVYDCSCLLESQRGRVDASLAPCERWVQSLEHRYGPDNVKVGEALEQLAGVQRQLGAYESALASIRRALAIIERTSGPRSADVVPPLLSAGHILANLHRLEEARPLLERAVTVAEATTGGYAGLLAQAYLSLGAACKRLGDADAARRYLDRAVVEAEKTLGSDHPELVEFLYNHAYNLIGVEAVDHDQLRRNLERAIVLAEKGGRKDRIAAAQRVLAALLVHLGRAAEAVPISERALAGAIETMPDPIMVAAYRFELGKTRVAAGDRERGRADVLAAREAFAAGGERDQAEVDRVDRYLAAQGL